jgi:hypothetical protein
MLEQEGKKTPAEFALEIMGSIQSQKVWYRMKIKNTLEYSMLQILPTREELNSPVLQPQEEMKPVNFEKKCR